MSQFLPFFLVAGSSILGPLGIYCFRRYRWMHSPWVGFVFLMPFLGMVALHRLLNLSDALMVQTPPGEREAHTYNIVMVVVFFTGITTFVVHALAVATTNRGWLAVKGLVLAAYWWGVSYLF